VLKPLPFLAITLGDPAGIGPWVAADAALHPAVRARCRPLLVGDASVLKERVSRPGLKVRPLAELDDYRPAPRTVNVLHVPHPNIGSLVLGRPQRVGGEAAALALRTAAALAHRRRVAAVVTGPVSKGSFKLAGLPFPGHTEMLAALSGVRRTEMIMCAGKLVTLLATRHLPLKDVPRALSVRGLTESVRRADEWMRKALGPARPRWAVCGLNPHAGDDGLLGSEEKRIVAPAVARFRRTWPGPATRPEGSTPWSRSTTTRA
jgi:4-hydroxy-L-threonine phosphate dehydrogenase PdxA